MRTHTGAIWAPLEEHLVAGHQVVIVDLRRHGKL